MAYPCKIWQKAECDGCGRCADDQPMGLFGRTPVRISDDEGYDGAHTPQEEDR